MAVEYLERPEADLQMATDSGAEYPDVHERRKRAQSQKKRAVLSKLPITDREELCNRVHHLALIFAAR